MPGFVGIILIPWTMAKEIQITSPVMKPTTSSPRQGHGEKLTGASLCDLLNSKTGKLEYTTHDWGSQLKAMILSVYALEGGWNAGYEAT